MGSGQSNKKLFHRIRQRIIGGIHIAEHCITTARRQDVYLQHCAQWRLYIAGDVGMPKLPIGYFGVSRCVDFEDFGIPRHGWCRWVAVKRAKPFSKINLHLRWNFLLIFEKQNLVGQKCRLNLCKYPPQKSLGSGQRPMFLPLDLAQ